MNSKNETHHETDILSSMWQQQQTEVVGLGSVKQKWRKVQYKQRLYFVFDLIGVLFMLGAFYIAFDKLGVFAKTWMAILTFFAGVTAVYFSYLRRFALSWSNLITESFIEQLKKQLISNIKIAKFNRDLSLWMVLAIVIFYAGMFYVDDVSLAVVAKKGVISLAILAAFTPLFWIWADRRAKRFSKELAALEQALLEPDPETRL